MEKLINEIEKVRVALSEISVYNLDSYTMAELYYNIAKKINEIIKELYRYEGIITEDIIEQNKKLEHLLNEGVNEEVISKINEMVSDGTFDSIINHSVFEGLNNKIENLESTYNNVKLFGAIGDGVADDTQAIQNAINSTVEGGVVYFPYGAGISSSSLKKRIYNNYKKLQHKANTHLQLYGEELDKKTKKGEQ